MTQLAFGFRATSKRAWLLIIYGASLNAVIQIFNGEIANDFLMHGQLWTQSGLSSLFLPVSFLSLSPSTHP